MGLFDGLFNRNRSAASTPYNPNPSPLSGFGPAFAGLGVEIATNRPGGGAGAFTTAAHQLGRRRELANQRALNEHKKQGTIDFFEKNAPELVPLAKSNPAAAMTLYAQNKRQAGSNAASWTKPQQGVDEEGNPIFFSANSRNEIKILDGVTPSNPIKTLDLGDRIVTVDSRTNQILGERKINSRDPAYDKAQGAVEGKAAGEAANTLADLESQMPQLKKTVDELSELGKVATYTKAGQLRDEARKQSGAPATEGAIARAEYESMVDNQVLPLLRQTFGAAFTKAEGDSLRATLGDPNATPEEKDAKLRAFIDQKHKQIAAGRQRTGASPRRRYNPETERIE